MGEVIVRLKVDKHNGTYESKILSHLDGSSCSDGVDDLIVQDLLNAEIEGFGELGSIEDSGKTCEFFEEKKAKHRPHTYIRDDEDEDGGTKKKKKKVGLGFGV